VSLKAASLPGFHQDESPVLYIHPAKQGVQFRPDANMGRTYGLMPVGVAGLVNVLRTVSSAGLNYHQRQPMYLGSEMAGVAGACGLSDRSALAEHCYGATIFAAVYDKPRCGLIVAG
jgi:hypothetical protein